MDIDKEKMKLAYLNCDKSKEAMDELISYCYDMAKLFVGRFKVSYNDREDFIQFSVNRAIIKRDKFKEGHINKEGKASEVFSYFYKMIYTNIQYCMRQENNRVKKIPEGSCSFDQVGDTVHDKNGNFVDDVVDSVASEQMGVDNYEEYKEEEHIIIEGKVYNKSDVMDAMKKARKMLRLWKKDSNYTPEVNSETDSQVLDFYNRLKVHHIETEKKAQERKAKKNLTNEEGYELMSYENELRRMDDECKQLA